MPHHKKDYVGLSNEDAAADAIRAGNATLRMYMIPFCEMMQEMQSPEFKAKLQRGPGRSSP